MRFGYLFCLGLMFSAACTHGPQFKQRDYIVGDVLTGKARFEGPGETPREARLLRSGKLGGMSLDITPISEPMVIQLVEDEGFKRSLSPKEIEKNKKERLKTFGGNKTCFAVSSSADSSDSANLQYLSIYYDRAGKLEKLTSMRPDATPEKQQHIGSTYYPGYSYRVGNHVSYSPGYSSSYSYSTYSSDSFFCTKSKIDLSKGVTLLVQARYSRGIPAEDFVWSVDPKDADVFRFNKGEPDYGGRDEWNRQRRAQIDAKLSTIQN